jgi:hypothetical protein
VIYRALPGGSDGIVLYYCLMATWTGLGDNTELFWAVLSHPQRAHSRHCRRHSPRSPSPLSPRRSPALLQPHRSLRDEGDEDVVAGVWTYVFPSNLKTVDADPSTSSSATTTSRPPQATSRRGSGPSDHHENNYFSRDRG